MKLATLAVAAVPVVGLILAVVVAASLMREETMCHGWCGRE